MQPEHLYIDSADAGQVTHVVIYRPDAASTADTQRQPNAPAQQPTASAPRAVLQMVHGMIEHIGRYADFAAWLCERGFAVVGHDHPGHGLSAFDATSGQLRPGALWGHYADNNGTAVVLENMWRVTQLAAREWPGVPIFIMGHSMGSFFTRRFITLHSDALAGAIVMGTGWHTRLETTPGLWLSRLIAAVKGGRTTSRILTLLTNGGYDTAFPGEGHNAWLSVNPDNVRAHNDDPYCQFEFTARAFADFFRCMNDLASRRDFDRIRRDLPVLVTSGSDDPVGGTKAVTKVADEYEHLGLTAVTRRLYPGLRHEILGETCREEVYRDLYDWILNVACAER